MKEYIITDTTKQLPDIISLKKQNIILNDIEFKVLNTLLESYMEHQNQIKNNTWNIKYNIPIYNGWYNLILSTIVLLNAKNNNNSPNLILIDKSQKNDWINYLKFINKKKSHISYCFIENSLDLKNMLDNIHIEVNTIHLYIIINNNINRIINHHNLITYANIKKLTKLALLINHKFHIVINCLDDNNLYKLYKLYNNNNNYSVFLDINNVNSMNNNIIFHSIFKIKLSYLKQYNTSNKYIKTYKYTKNIAYKNRIEQAFIHDFHNVLKNFDALCNEFIIKGYIGCNNKFLEYNIPKKIYNVVKTKIQDEQTCNICFNEFILKVIFKCCGNIICINCASEVFNDVFNDKCFICKTKLINNDICIYNSHCNSHIHNMHLSSDQKFLVLYKLLNDLIIPTERTRIFPKYSNILMGGNNNISLDNIQVNNDNIKSKFLIIYNNPIDFKNYIKSKYEYDIVKFSKNILNQEILETLTNKNYTDIVFIHKLFENDKDILIQNISNNNTLKYIHLL